MSQIEFSDEYLSQMWDNFDFEKAEEKIRKLQYCLTKATYAKDREKMIKLDVKITSSIEARALAVREVSEKGNATVGIDGVRWVTSAEKMRAVFDLSCVDYKAKNYRRFIITDSKTAKERKVNIPAMKDRAMQILYMMSLSPISEATADRKSFAYRKGRSSFDVHSLIMHFLTEKNTPEYVLVCDIKSYYDSISHEWLLRNIPMDKNVLREFLKAGIVFNNEIFPPEDVGISLGNNISTILGNMTLDGIQKLLYDLQNKDNIDYYDGYAIRFADDILITARTRESANLFLQKIKEFAFERGLTLSDNKTYITTIKEGFEFLSRRYQKVDNIIHCTPSEKAILKLENELSILINQNKRWSQKKLIEQLNAKLTGWATYHRVEESLKDFIHIDVVVSALLLRFIKETHPKTTVKTLIKKYWYKDNKGRQVFALTTNKNIKVIKLEDVLLVRHKRLDVKKNIFLDEDYFKKRNDEQNIYKVSGRYKKVWDRQDGKCYFCNNSIRINQPKKIIIKNLTIKDDSIKNMAYVHANCSNSETTYINIDTDNMTSIDINELISSINDFDILKVQTKNSKYSKLYEYFAKSTKSTFVLKFTDIEKIIGFELCKSLYNYENYWNMKGKNLISNCWLRNGYKIKRIYLKEKKVTFIRAKKQLSRVEIPDKILSSSIPRAAKEELECFFEYIISKYGL